MKTPAQFARYTTITTTTTTTTSSSSSSSSSIRGIRKVYYFESSQAVPAHHSGKGRLETW